MPLQAAPARTAGRTLLGVGIVVSVAAALFVMAAVPTILRVWRAADYPGAARLSDHNNVKLGSLDFRRDTTYRTGDPFPRVYNWYSSGHNLGPEARAQSNCILIERVYHELYVVERYMGVTMCDTPAGRMIYVTRTIALRGH